MHTGTRKRILLEVGSSTGLGSRIGFSRIMTIIEIGAEMLTPFLTFCGAAFLFGERLSALQWAGGLGVIAGCALMIGAHERGPESSLQP